MNRLIRILVSLCCLISSGLAVVSCNKQKKFEWLASVTSPEMYPIMVHQSVLIYKDGYTYLDSGDYLAGRWGGSGSKNYTDTSAKPVPYRLVITWLSWAESKFYKGVFDLPTEKIEDYFKKGYINYEGQWETYSIILVGMAPEGVVVVWLLGNSACVEIDRFQAETTEEYSVRDIAPGANGLWGEYPSIEQFAKEMLEPEVKEYVKQNGLGEHLWDKYRERFSFRVKWEYESDKGKTNKVCHDFYNGESGWLLDSAEINNPTYAMQARIKQIVFDWIDGEQIFRSNITFDEKEIFSAYEQIYKGDPARKGGIVCRVNRSNDSIQVFFRGENRGDTDSEIRLDKCTIAIYNCN